MYTFIVAFTIAFLIAFAEVFFKTPNLIKIYFDWAEEKRYGGKAAFYTCIFWLPLQIVSVVYGLGTIAGFYFGFADALADVGTFFVFLFFGGYLRSFGSFAKDVGDIAYSRITRTERPQSSTISQGFGIIFVSGGFGTAVMLALYTAGVFAGP